MLDQDAEGTPAYWDKVDADFGGEPAHAGAWKGYCAGTGFGGTASSPLYRDEMHGIMRRSLDLSGYSNAVLRFWIRIPSIETGYDECRVSLLGPVPNQILWSSLEQISAWSKVVIPLDPTMVWPRDLAFEFLSDVSVSREGWYLDDVAVIAGHGPTHDFFDLPLPLLGASGAYSGSTANTSKELGEPDHANDSGGSSVWFAWTAPSDGRFVFTTQGSGFDTTLAAYEGETLQTLERLAANDDIEPGLFTSSLAIEAVAGGVYWLALDGFGGQSGSFELAWRPLVDPPQIVSLTTQGHPTRVQITWSEPLTPFTLANGALYRVEGANVLGVNAGGDSQSVTLTTSPLEPDIAYTLIVRDVRDLDYNSVFPNPTQTAFVHGAEYPAFHILYHRYNVGEGNLLSVLTNHASFPSAPVQLGFLGLFEIPGNSDDVHGARLSGIYQAPETGYYRFYMASDGQGALFISQDGNPAHRTQMAFEPLGSSPRNYTGLNGRSAAAPENRSGNFLLAAGQNVYVEALVKERTGAGHLSVAVQLPGATTAPGTPMAADAFLQKRHFGGTTFLNFGSVVFLQSPTNRSVAKNSWAVFDAWVDGTPPYRFQWRRDGIPMPGETNLVLRLGPVSASDDGSDFELEVSNEFSSATSASARLTVVDDTSLPLLLSASSVDGIHWGLQFNEPLDPGSANHPGHYEAIDNEVIAAELLPDRQSVELTMATVVTELTVRAAAVRDEAGNFAGEGAWVAAQQWAESIDIGEQPIFGGAFSSKKGEVQIKAGGADMWGSSDEFHFVYRAVSGDFDLSVRVESLEAVNSWSKAGLMIRETMDGNSRAIQLNTSPLPSLGAGLLEAGLRSLPGTSTRSWGGGPATTLPNLWLRLVRIGDEFKGYYSSNGGDWLEYAFVREPFAVDLVVGMGVTAHDRTRETLASFSEFRLLLPEPITLSVVRTQEGEIRLGGLSTNPEAGRYVIEASGNLENWVPIQTNSPPYTGDMFVDPEAAQWSHRFYRVTH